MAPDENVFLPINAASYAALILPMAAIRFLNFVKSKGSFLIAASMIAVGIAGYPTAERMFARAHFPLRNVTLPFWFLGAYILLVTTVAVRSLLGPERSEDIRTIFFDASILIYSAFFGSYFLFGGGADADSPYFFSGAVLLIAVLRVISYFVLKRHPKDPAASVPPT